VKISISIGRRLLVETIIDTKNLLTIKQAAKLVGKSYPMIQKLRQEGVIDSVELGYSPMIKKDSLIKVALERGWIKQRKG